MKFDRTLPLNEAWTIPNHWYTDQGISQRERKMFSRHWQCVGRLDQLTEIGSYFTVNVFNEPIVVIRTKDAIKAFYNVCRHRAAEVLSGCGIASKLRCPYHGWTYDLDGKLIGTPEFSDVKNFSKENFNLPELNVATFGNLVFVRNGNGQDLIDYLRPLEMPTELKFFERKVYEIKCNWKVYIDNYLDGGLHIHSIHPELAKVIDYKNYRTELHKNVNVQISPLESGNDVRTGTAYYWWAFPNLMVNVYDGVMDTNHVLPLGVNKCIVHMDFYFSKNKNEQYMKDSISVADKVQKEDVDICESVQRGLESSSFESGRFSVKREAGGYHFHQLLADKI